LKVFAFVWMKKYPIRHFNKLIIAEKMGVIMSHLCFGWNKIFKTWLHHISFALWTSDLFKGFRV
jgi:hypothetical protein